jgi:hypothetical protein
MEDKEIDYSKPLFEKTDDGEGEKVVKMNAQKELVVNVENIESLLNAIEYSTNKIKDVDAIASGEALKESLQKIEEIRKNMPKQSILKSLSFEIEKLSNLDKSFSKLRGVHIAVTAALTAIITIAAMTWTEFDNKLVHNYILNGLKKENLVASKKFWKVQNSNKNRVVLIKK